MKKSGNIYSKEPVQGILLLCIILGLSISCGALVATGSAASPGMSVNGSDPGWYPPLLEPSGGALLLNDLPVANFSAKEGVLTKFSVYFDGSQSEGSDLNYQWSFDDGSVMNTESPVKFYEGPVAGLVTLKVSNSIGSDSITKRLEVANDGTVILRNYTESEDIQHPFPEITLDQLPQNTSYPLQTPVTAGYLEYFIAGLQLMEKGNLPGAIESFNGSIRANSSFPGAYSARGLAFFQIGYHNFYEFEGREEFNQARDDFSKAIELDPGNIQSIIGRGATQVYLGEYALWRSYIPNESVLSSYEAGLSDFNRALEEDPDNIDALNGKAFASLVLGSGNPAIKSNSSLVDSAKKATERSLGINDTNPRAHFILGLYYDHEGIPIKSIQEFSKAIDQDPFEAWYYEWRGYEKIRKGDYEDALDDYDVAITLQPRFAQAYNMRGVSQAYLMNVNDRSLELSDFNHAVEINPDISDFQRNYALTLSNWKFWDKSLNEHAVDILTRASTLDPTDYRLHGDKAYLLTLLNRNHEATEELIRYQHGSLTNEERMNANDLLAYNNQEPWYSNTWG